MNLSTNNIFHYLFHTRRRFVLFAIAPIVFILYQLDKTIRLDDDLIGEQVYYLLKEGHVKSEMMRGYGNLKLELHQTVFHKLFVYWGALISWFFGWSLYSLHAASMLCFIAFIILLYNYYNRRQQPEMFCFVSVFTLISYNILYFSNCFRPEMMLMTFGFCGYWFLEKYLSLQKIIYLLLASVFCSFAFATHPHGIIYCVAGFLLLIFYKKYLAAISFGIVASLIFSTIYFADIIYFNQYDFFIFQLKNDPIINVHQHHWYTPIVKLFEEHIRLLFNEREIITTSLLVVGVLFNYKTLVANHRKLLLYGLFCFVALGALTYSKSPQYLLLYYPFTVFIIGYSWRYIEERKIRYQKITYRILLTAFCGIHLFFAGKKIVTNIQNFSQPSLSTINHSIASKIPKPHKDLSILSYDNFIFDEIKNFKRIQTLTVYSFFSEQQHKPKMNLSEIISVAKKDSIDYIILNKHYLDYFEVTTSETIQAETIEFSKDLLILKLN